MHNNKRSVTPDRGIAQKLARLERKVNSNKPEIKYVNYPISILPNETDPIDILRNIEADGNEFKLHRVTIGWASPDDREATAVADLPWGVLYSPNQGYTEITSLPEQTPAQIHTGYRNYLYHFDKTQARVWKRMKDIMHAEVINSLVYGLHEIEKSWSIPMTCSIEEDTVVRNQLYMVGSIVPEAGLVPNTLYVTVWYSDA